MPFIRMKGNADQDKARMSADSVVGDKFEKPEDASQSSHPEEDLGAVRVDDSKDHWKQILHAVDGEKETMQALLSDYPTEKEDTHDTQDLKFEFIEDETCAGENETKSAKVKEPLVNLESKVHKEGKENAV